MINYCAVANDRRYGYTKLPDEKYWLKDQEIAGSKQMEEDKEDFQDAGEDGTAHTYGDLNLISSHKSKEELLSDLQDGETDNETGFVSWDYFREMILGQRFHCMETNQLILKTLR